jgi:ribonuclease PH
VEYIATSEAPKECVWIKKFMIELGVVPSVPGPIEICCDNNGAIAQAKELRSHEKNKHIRRNGSTWMKVKSSYVKFIQT